MTSSLVGSEMCIRDRHRVNRGGYMLYKKQESNIRTGCSCRPGNKQDWACLLYTSDAADDM
eukprot:11184583-Prorocentrum_lima.AAC.1